MQSAGDLTLPLRDAIDIPERVHADDFVLQLHRGVTTSAEQTLDDYVVTDAISRSVDEALGLVQSAVRRGTSKGAFIHGSFGAGKSHFMAVVQLLLSGNSRARAKKGLSEVASRYPDLLDKRFLSVDYHLLGKENFESALFAGYLQVIRDRHPEAPAPILHRSDALLDDADRLRERMGDDAFFAGLPGDDAAAESGWGTQAQSYTAETFEAARALPADHPERQRLVQKLVASYFSASTTTGQWLEISQGLRVMTEHAKTLGYDGVVLFLDELVLWLAQHLGDMRFIQDETSKVAKLVETEMTALPVPLISFVARQRDLKDFLGGSAVGAEQVALGQSFQWWEDRFDPITLQAADLPEIVKKRLLEPVDDRGAAALEAAVHRVSANRTAWRHLLEDEAGSSGQDFAKVYPFSPALVDAMIALSSLMQRERTALKLMSELLSEGRGELTVGDVIPVGDLFDVVVLGDAKPLTDDMKRLFGNAAKFYREKVRPFLLDKHSLTDAQAKNLPRRHPFKTDDRLAKTLLVAEIAPGAASLKNLTASKLAALNFGTVRAFVPGQETQQVVTLARSWAAAFGEVSVGAGPDPIISVQLSGVDYDAVLDRVQSEDTSPARRRLIREVLLAELGMTTTGGLLTEYEYRHVWRGRRWATDVVFGNVRDRTSLTDDAFNTTTTDRWKLVIDFPFDDDLATSPSDDVARVDQLRTDGMRPNTLVWLPHFLSASRMDDVGTLVQLEYLLTGQHFDENAISLPVNDREPARRQLMSRRDSLRDQLATALRQAYAVQSPTEENVGAQVPAGSSFMTLADGLRLQAPAAPGLRDGLDQVLGQALEFQYPQHPKVQPSDVEVRKADLAATLDLARRAAAAGGRVEGVERAKANALRRIVEGFRVGTLRENVYHLDASDFGMWDDFTRWVSDTPDVPVSALRRQLSAYGMTSDAEDLLILAWVALADRQFWHSDQRVVPLPDIGSLSPQIVLREPTLPAGDAWEEAQQRARSLFGASAERHKNTASVRRVADAARRKAEEWRAAARDLVTQLELHSAVLGLNRNPGVGRLTTARRALQLVDLLAGESDDTSLVEELASFGLGQDPEVLVHSLTTAAQVAAALKGARWDVIRQLEVLDDLGSRPIAAALAEAGAAEEKEHRLSEALSTAAEEVTAILVGRRLVDDRDEVARREAEEARRRAEAERRRVEDERRRAEEQQQLETAERLRLEQERLEQERREIDAARRQAEEKAHREREAQAEGKAGSTRVSTADDLVTLRAALERAMRQPVEGKTLRVKWSWE